MSGGSSDAEVVRRAVKAYVEFVVHKLAYRKGYHYEGDTADDILSKRWPKYGSDRDHQLGYHHMSEQVIEIAEKALPGVLRRDTNLRICAYPPCRNVLKDRFRVDQICCSKVCSGEMQRLRSGNETSSEVKNAQGALVSEI